MSGPVQLAAEIARIELLGAPRAVLLDEGAMGAESSVVGSQVRRLLAALGLDVVVLVAHDVSLSGPTVGIFASDHPSREDCYAWYVGSGPAPQWMRPTAGGGPRTSAEILSLLGTGLAQERAGAAFRAAGAGLPRPSQVHYDATVLEGITRAVAGQVTSPPDARSASGLPTTRTREVLLRKAFAALDRCCADNGAIAAAPRNERAGAPDYWFFWQRDAAHVAFALKALARRGPDEDVRERSRARLAGYVEFVAALGPVLAREPGGLSSSRCTMAGARVRGYGDPQHDGPAATVLAVLSAVEDPQAALAVARPFLDHLLTVGADDPGFDLWELTVGSTLHATNLRRRAMRRAAGVAAAAGDEAADSYRAASERLAEEVDLYRDPAGGLRHARGPQPPWFGATTQLDMSIVGSALLGYDATDDVLPVDDPDLAVTMRRLEEGFAVRWPVNAGWPAGGVGRFPEDCNDGLGSTGGNPWPVTTLWAAQYHLRRGQRAAAPGDHDREVATALGHLAFVLAHVDATSISEQIDGSDGSPRGAGPLAWAHAELVLTIAALDDPAAPPGLAGPRPVHR